MSAVDPAILKALGLDPPASNAKLAPIGHSGFTSTYKLTAPSRPGQSCPSAFFVKIAAGDAARIMFRGEHASLNAIHDVVPDLCPRSHAHGELVGAGASAPEHRDLHTDADHDSDTDRGPDTDTDERPPRQHLHFLVTDFLDTGPAAARAPPQGASLAVKLARLHTTPAPAPADLPAPAFGFPVPTCCGDTPQDNSWRASWADFFADNRLRAVARREVRAQGPDAELARCVERVAAVVVPRLLGPGTLRGIAPVVVHGDLWSGNHARGRIIGGGGGSGSEELVFDPACVYGHSEYELGIMRMFGGFGGAFWKEYEKLVPRADPADEWDDRLLLYEL
ncbi:Fructosamine-3-kinase [Escovopsis weberi]|uniref:protein-ribulosamine 3-kinase n=1 Tax=Escovopsis weberi TaxID=150374 RepID=A0A0M9VWB6_ESCWE|nr:Fructosamine-3-kinase [Escovopsis weberi]